MDLEWKDQYAIGHPVIDAEHQHLFALARAFVEATGQRQLQAVAMQLYKHTREHFAHEEQLMRDTQYPDYQRHARRHDRMIARLNDISADIGANATQRAALESWVRTWIVHHVAHDDAHLARHLLDASPSSADGG